MKNSYQVMRFQITGFENDPEFRRLCLAIANAKSDLISYYNDAVDLHLVPDKDDPSILHLDDSAIEDSPEYQSLIVAFNTAKRDYVHYLNKTVAFKFSPRFCSEKNSGE